MDIAKPDPQNPSDSTKSLRFDLARLLAALALVAFSILLALSATPALNALRVVHGWVAHQFFEVPQLAALRASSQLAILRYQLIFWSPSLAIWLLVGRKCNREVRTLGYVLLIAWAIRAGAWVVGGNLPLIPGDSSHYIETANSVSMGLPSSKHYVESFFRDYPPIRAGRPVLDDWATPLYADTLGLLYRYTGYGIGPGKDLTITFGMAKGLSFLFNLWTLPCLYLFTRRCVNASAALPATALAAILPVHAIYAGMELRESLVGLTSLVAVWLAHEFLLAQKMQWKIAFAILAGLAGGLAILSRNTAMALVFCLGLWLIWKGGRRSFAYLPIWAGMVLIVIAPWAWLTYKEYGKPFYSYTEHFALTFSWSVHHYAAGVPNASAFYLQNRPELIRVKIKSVLILFGYSTMILSMPVAYGFYRRLRRPVELTGRATDHLAIMLFLTFAAATIQRIADVTQVAQLGRYYMPVYLIMLPTAVRGLMELKWPEFKSPGNIKLVAAASLIGCLWADPTWAYDASWFVKPFQLHWSGLLDAGQFIEQNPDQVPANARVMSWFPWEMRVTSDRITVLMPRNFDARRIREVIEQYGVTHVVWGSFETPQHVDPESFGPYLTSLKTSLGLSSSNEIYRTARGAGGMYPVSIYRIARP
ncbi:MAG: hypothetical protein DWI24_02450 [Planctomycetota bacterium]|nr:MAG: hypothetical protein DWI24_02450 [Planctomycetota bacterium]